MCLGALPVCLGACCRWPSPCRCPSLPNPLTLRRRNVEVLLGNLTELVGLPDTFFDFAISAQKQVVAAEAQVVALESARRMHAMVKQGYYVLKRRRPEDDAE